MFSSTAALSSSTNGFGSRVGFGQSINPNVSSTASSGSQYTFGQGSSLFGSAPNNGGTSTGVFGGSSFGQNSNPFQSAPSNGGTSMGVFGGSLFCQSSNLFGSSPNNGGTSMGVFGQTASSNSFGQSSNIFGSAPNSGGTSTGVFGQKASSIPFGQSSNIFGSVPSNGGASTGLFGQTVSSSSFGQSSNLFGSSPNNGGTSMGVFGQTASSNSFGQSSNIFGSVPNNGRTSTAVFGQKASSIPFGQSSNIFGSVPSNGGASTGLFGQTASSSSFGQSSNVIGSVPNNGGTSAGVFGQTSSSSSFGQSSNIFGSVPSNGGASTGLFGQTASSSPFGFQHTFGSVPASSGTPMSVFGVTSSSPILWSSSTGSTTFSQVPASFASSSSGFGSDRMTSSGQATVPWDRTSLSGANKYSFGTQSFGEKRGSKVTPYTKTTGFNDDKGKWFVSISAMPAYKDKSHEELRWEDHDQYNAGGGGAVPASVQSNDFRNPIARTDSAFPSHIPPSVSSNPFSTAVTPPSTGQHSFLNPAHPSVSSNPFATAVTPFSIGQPSFQNPAPPSVPSNPFSAAVTPPSTGQYSFQNPEPPSVPSNPLSTVVTTPSLDAAQPSQNTEVKQSPIPSPFGTPSAVPPMLTAPPVKYGISSIPVCDKPAPARGPSLLNIRHLSYHRQRWLPIQKYKPKSDGPMVAFFSDAQKTPTIAKMEAPLLPRSNPRAFISGLYEELNLRVNFNNTFLEKNSSTGTYEIGEVGLTSAPDQGGSLYQDTDVTGISSETDTAEHNCNTDPVYGDLPIKKKISLNVYELMPKLKHSDYFFEPRVEELVIKESYEPGFCSHVKDFVVGRQGYGNIKFLEETDVRELDLESCIEFRNREVIVYMDESKKPPVGQGLNKAAEITLCNIKVVDKKTGKQYIDGPNVDKFKEKLMKKTAEQGAEFVSYNPVQGEWKFRVQHF